MTTIAHVLGVEKRERNEAFSSRVPPWVIRALDELAVEEGPGYSRSAIGAHALKEWLRSKGYGPGVEQKKAKR